MSPKFYVFVIFFLIFYHVGTILFTCFLEIYIGKNLYKFGFVSFPTLNLNKQKHILFNTLQFG